MGTVLSSFFWGYSLTQILGGYLSDRIGAERVLLASGLGWGLITFWFHQIVRAISDHDRALTLIVIARVLLGAFQVGNVQTVSVMNLKTILWRSYKQLISFVFM